MLRVCFAERAGCFLNLGRLEEAAAACEESIRRAEKLDDDRGVAVGKLQLGTIRKNQRSYQEALNAYKDACERFTQLGEPGSVATSWHQIGIACQQAGQPESAEDAYHKSLEINVRLENVTGEAFTLGQLGNLYDDVLNRPEDAVAFYRQAADKYVKIGDVAHESSIRNNLAATLRKLHRFDDARQEIRRAIESKESLGHARSIWTAWTILANIETDAGNPTDAAAAKHRAIACYLAYRRDGGENHHDSGRLCLDVTQSLLAGKSAAATAILQQLVADPEAAHIRPFIQALQAIVNGSRDRTLANGSDLNYTMAAEILLLIERLEGAR
jgi:tetratricopeptide (TPR) repeat protein